MEVTVTLSGGDVETVTLDGGTYGDLLREVGLSPQAATVLVDGRPVPDDDEVDATEVHVLRLISGGDHRSDQTTTVRIGPAEHGDASRVLELLDAAMLAIDRDRIRSRIGTPDVLVARMDERIRGALILDDQTVTAVAVERSFRDRGIGSALVTEAAARRGRVRARFDASVKPFYDSVGFEIRDDGDRFIGELEGST